MATKRHHYLPKFYLEKFMPSGEKTICVYDKRDGTEKWLQPVNAGVEGRLYSVINPEGEHNDIIETDIMAPLDGTAKAVIDRYLDGESLGRDEIATLSTFMAAAHLRVPRQIALIQELGGLTAIKMAEELAKDKDKFEQMIRQFNAENPDKTIVDPQSIRDDFMNIRDKYDVTMGREHAMVSSIKLVDEVAGYLRQMIWMSRVASNGEHFITGDSPLSVFIQYPDGRASFGAGFDHPDVEIAFPLTPSMCLYLRKRPSPEFPTVLELNRRIVRQADRFIVSSVQSDEVREMVSQFSDEIPKFDKDALFERHSRKLDGKANPIIQQELLPSSTHRT